VRTLKSRLLLIVILLLVSCFSTRHAVTQSDVERSYLVIDYNGNFHTLNVTVPYSLYQYYVEKRQSLNQPSGYNPCDYVTPQAVKPIADCLLSVSRDKEDFVNQVLKWNRQHVYRRTYPIYPVETLYLGYGDCDTFSILVASILIAGNITDILFLSWQLNETCFHMNLAVHLPYTPKYYTEGTGTLYWVTFNNKKYYLAECTDQCKGPTEISYVLGNIPEGLQDKLIDEIFPIVDYDNSFVEQVYASFNLPEGEINVFTSHFIDLPLLDYTTISFIYPITIEGSVNSNETETVTLYYSHDGKNWKYLTEIQTVNGYYSYTWYIIPRIYIRNFTIVSYEFIFPEKLYVKAYLNGSERFSSTYSETISFIYIPLWLIILIIIFICSLFRRRK